MKIEETPFQFHTAATPGKLRAGASVSAAGGFDELELSFLDLLNSVSTAAPEAAATDDTLLDAMFLKAQALEKPASDLEKAVRPKLNLVKSTETASKSTEDPVTQVEKDMTLLQNELSAIDIQYLKQSVIPGLPILLGSVPIESVFPQDGDGQISYKGFEISPKLADLIEKGYKTGRPIRVELDPKSAVVLKIRNGQVSAEFVSSDRTMSLVMQQELDDLRHRMTLKNLPVGNLEAKYQNPHQSRKDDKEQSSHDQE